MKVEIPKDWCIAAAKREGDSEVGAGLLAMTPTFPEDDCPGHVASVLDPKVCGRCGIHIDSLRPDDGDNI